MHPLRLWLGGPSGYEANYSIPMTQPQPGLISAATQWLLGAEDWPKEAEPQGLSPNGLGPGQKGGGSLGVRLISGHDPSFYLDTFLPSESGILMCIYHSFSFTTADNCVCHGPHIPRGQPALP